MSQRKIRVVLEEPEKLERDTIYVILTATGDDEYPISSTPRIVSGELFRGIKYPDIDRRKSRKYRDMTPCLRFNQYGVKGQICVIVSDLERLNDAEVDWFALFDDKLALSRTLEDIVHKIKNETPPL